MQVRGATPADAAGVAPLLTALGYPATPDAVAERIAARQATAADVAWVVVDDARRRGGVGRALVAEFERWAEAIGCVRVSVATAFHRADAHAFYESLGFVQLARKYQKDRSPDA